MCPVCGGAVALLMVHTGWKHARCSHCGHVFLTDPPSQASLAEFYSTSEDAQWNTHSTAMLHAYRRNPTAMRRYYHHDRLRHLAGLVRKSATVLDIGCSSGVFLATLRDAGMEVTGQDLSPQSTEAGRRELGIQLLNCPLSQLRGPFDLITSYDVIEHWIDPKELVQSIRRLSHRDTDVVLRTPNHGSWLRAVTGRRWLWYMPPAHIHLFTAASLRQLLEDNGFRIMGVKTLASSYIYFAAYYLAGGLVAPGNYSLDMPRWKEAAVYGLDTLLKVALSPVLMIGNYRYANPLLEVHARLR
jgi:2-polyprenyl-3-methyl-5-hydroxy-6-metoxy-1,4-benzoquinol methylase